jgi:two-component system, OmpR family, sensor histidine kinase ChvG
MAGPGPVTAPAPAAGPPPPRRAGRAATIVRRLVDELVRIRVRLLVINVIAVLVPVVGLEWARTYEREALGALEQDMRHQAELLRTLLEENPDGMGRPGFAFVGRALELAAKRTRTRVRLLDREGAVLFDSHRAGAPEGPEPAIPDLLGRGDAPRRRHPRESPATDPGSIKDRVEIRTARKGQIGTATRIHQRIQRVFLFLALPVMVSRRVEGIVYVNRSTVPVLLSLHRLRARLVQVLALALGFTALLSLFLAATISRPLGRLTRASKRIAEGDRTVNLRLERRDEIGQLAGSFALLLEKLDARARYIAEFAANISHEFKTPIASIRGAAELLVDGADEDPAARRRFLENILADAGRLDRLVSRILELSRIEAAAEERAPLDVAALVAEVVDRFPGHPLEVELSSDPLPFVGNGAHLLSALVALVENAVRHSPEDKPVRIEAWRDPPGDGALVLRVVDQGSGISEANKAKVFERFFTTEAARGGAGLGLSIVSAVALAHGGTLRLESELGRGTTVEIRLPAHVA